MKITVTVDSLLIERLLYYLIILVLAFFVIKAYWLSPACEPTDAPAQVVQGPQVQATPPTSSTASANTSPTLAELCSNGVQDANESAIDCGGRCAELNGEYFYNGTCHGVPEFVNASDENASEPAGPAVTPGEREFEIVDVDYEINPLSGKIKVLSVELRIANGKADLEEMSAEVWIKDERNVMDSYHTIGSSLNPYETLSFPTIERDELYEERFSLSRPYLLDTTDEDPFKLVIEFLTASGKVGEASETITP